MNKLLSLTFLSLFASSLGAAEPCRYAEFRPGFVFERLIYRAYESRVGVIGPAHTIKGLAGGRYSLVADGVVLAQISQVRDVAKGLYELTVLSPLTDEVLLQVTETKVACNSGLCHRLQMWTALQKPTETAYPFVATSGPRDFGPVTFSRYGTEVGHGTFGREFASAFRWLFDVLLTSKNGYRPELKEMNERLSWALASDAEVAPYFDRFTFSLSQHDPRVVIVNGVAPSNFIHGLVVDRLREAGFANVNPQIRIDSRTSILWMRPQLVGCY